MVRIRIRIINNGWQAEHRITLEVCLSSNLQVRQTQCGINCFIQGAGTKTHLKSRFCLQAILKKRGAM